MAAKFVVTEGNDGKYYFSLKAANGEVVLSSQGYKNKDDALNGIDSVKRNSTDEKRYEVKKSSDDKDYFVLTATNGQTIGKSQMYISASGCKGGMESVMKNAGDAATESA